MTNTTHTIARERSAYRVVRLDRHNPYDDPGTIFAEFVIQFTAGGHDHRVADVSRFRCYGQSEPTTTINWSAWGAQPADVAEAFADAMSAAVEYAHEIGA